MVQPFYTTLLNEIYDSKLAEQVGLSLQELSERYRKRISPFSETGLSEHDAILITYGDQVQEPPQAHIKTLADFCETHLTGVVSGLHLLPFFPWSSDDGFAVKDYLRVDPPLGNWGDVERLGRSFRLMVDGVINHISVQNKWFQAFLRDEEPYNEYFLTVEGDPDLSMVVRPRSLPLLTEFETSRGKRRVWTTFSADQADLDYHNPEVLLEMIDILLFYVEHAAQFLRLDAIAYLWKEIGTACIHLPQTHTIVQLLRAVLAETAPHVRLITETNVPHEDNISYFGDGSNEAQLVYNFALPPLVLHTLRTGNAAVLSQWASGLETPSEQTTYFNFLASHDGIGLNPARGILTQQEINSLVEQTTAHGGLISYKQNMEGSQSPYELNINYFDALSNPYSNERITMQVARFMAAQAILLCLRGVPGIYFHSLFGSRNWNEGARITGRNRSINREKYMRRELEEELSNQGSLRNMVFDSYRHLLSRRSSCVAFHPHGGQEILDFGPGIFAVRRISPDGKNRMLCLQNITAQDQRVSLGDGTRKLHAYQTHWVADQ